MRQADCLSYVITTDESDDRYDVTRCDWAHCLRREFDGVHSTLLNAVGRTNVVKASDRFVFLCGKHFKLAAGDTNRLNRPNSILVFLINCYLADSSFSFMTERPAGCCGNLIALSLAARVRNVGTSYAPRNSSWLDAAACRFGGGCLARIHCFGIYARRRSSGHRGCREEQYRTSAFEDIKACFVEIVQIALFMVIIQSQPFRPLLSSVRGTRRDYI